MSALFPLRLDKVQVRRRGKVILGPVDFTLGSGGFTIVLGPNGAGKTTFLKSMHGIERVSAGRVDWALPERAAHDRQAYVFQSPILLRRSVAENLGYPLALAREPRDRIKKDVSDWAGRIGLGDALNTPAHRLSGGEKQKLALARALIRRPDVLFLDEPTANLDGRSTREIETLLRGAHGDGTTIVMATHDLGQARRLADRILFLLHGQIHDQGATDALLDGAGSPEFQAFVRGDIIE